MSITLNDNFQNNSGKALDHKAGKVVTGRTAPYASVAEANATIASAYRHKGLLAMVDEGDGKATWYVYRAGITDSDLVPLIDEGERVAYNANGFYDIGPGYLLEKIIVEPGSDATIKIGSTAGGEEYSPPLLMSSASGEVLLLNLYAKASTRRIYFTGIPTGTSIVFFKRKVKS